MNAERRVAVITDSGCSIRPNSSEARSAGVTVIPLNLGFWNAPDNQYISHADDSVSIDEFYTRMRSEKKLPQTSGAMIGRISQLFQKLLPLETVDSIISIHVTSKHSVAWQSADTAKNIIQERVDSLLPQKPIEVVDSKLVSLAMWFPVRLAGELARKGASLEQIKKEVTQAISKTHLFISLKTLENLRRGGRADEIAQAVFASMLSISPILGLSDGKLQKLGMARNVEKARERMVEMVSDAGKLIHVAVVHTNAIGSAEKVKEALGKKFSGPISIHEAGPVLAVHAGEGAIGIAFQIE